MGPRGWKMPAGRNVGQAEPAGGPRGTVTSSTELFAPPKKPIPRSQHPVTAPSVTTTLFVFVLLLLEIAVPHAVLVQLSVCPSRSSVTPDPSVMQSPEAVF